MMKKTRLLLFLILVFSLIGVADSIHLLEIKYGGEGLLNCDLSETFNCSGVNHSPQSTVLGFPTAGLGLIGYSLLALMSGLLFFRKDLQEKAFFERLFEMSVTPFTLLLVAGAGLMIQLYFTGVEFFVLEQFCIFCLFSQALILGIAVFAYLDFKK